MPITLVPRTQLAQQYTLGKDFIAKSITFQNTVGHETSLSVALHVEFMVTKTHCMYKNTAKS
ncbi:pectinesterase [Medicago truncatula]|uniref:Pectinesterase n=1 Tax=Medicago truncatula TaxID=3880 RepID=G7L1P9_MEDTR|nr:pectinesterase [Medicago truncatula]